MRLRREHLGERRVTILSSERDGVRPAVSNETRGIEQVRDAYLCNTCGACFGVCPGDAVTFTETVGGYEVPKVDPSRCSSCDLCLRVCAGRGLSDGALAGLPKDPFAGVALDSWVGKATDPEVFGSSQSGGVVTALLMDALESGLIAAAAVVEMKAGTPPRPHAVLARGKDELVRAQRSKYSPVPLLKLLKDLDKIDGRVAFVGTSCHIHALRNVLEARPSSREKIAFTIGLVCAQVMTHAAVEHLSRTASVAPSRAWQMYWRDKTVSGYPGDVHFVSDDGSQRVLSRKARMAAKEWFTPARCRLCFDKMNVLSDITVGDPHGLKSVDRRRGESMVVTRTEAGERIVNDAMQRGAVLLRPALYEEILRGQGIEKKREQWHGYVQAWRDMGRELPNYVEHVEKDPARRGPAYRRALEYSLGLDAWPSRRELLDHVRRGMRVKRLGRVALFPARLTRRIVSRGYRALRVRVGLV